MHNTTVSCDSIIVLCVYYSIVLCNIFFSRALPAILTALTRDNQQQLFSLTEKAIALLDL